MDFTLEPHQLKAVKACINQRGVLVVLPPGRGKTAIALGILRVRIRARRISTAVIFVHKQGMGAYRKLTGGLPINHIETIEDLRALGPTLDYRADQVFVVNTGLFPRWPEEFEDVKKRKKGSSEESPYELNGRTLADSSLLRLVEMSGMVVIDEVHNYRNIESSTTSSILDSLLANYRGYRMAFTATPYYRNIDNVFFAVDTVCPGFIGTYKDFRDRYCIVVNKPTTVYRWVMTPAGRRKMLVDTTFPEVVGYQNLEEFWGKVLQHTYVDQSHDFTIEWDLRPYELTDWKEYSRIIAGLGIDEGTRITYAGEKSVGSRVFRRGETILVRNVAYPDWILKEAMDVRAGDEIVLGIHKEPYKVRKVTKADSEADIIARLQPLARHLSTRPEKLSILFGVLDSVPQDRGAAVFVRLHETVDFLEGELSRRYPGRTISIIKGGEGNASELARTLGPTDFVLLTQVAFQSIDFYYDTIVAYDVLRLPGELTQLVGRITRLNSPFREVRAVLILGSGTIEHYFHSRLLFLLKDCPIDGSQVPELPYPGFSVFNKNTSLRMLKDALLWRRPSRGDPRDFIPKEPVLAPAESPADIF